MVMNRMKFVFKFAQTEKCNWLKQSGARVLLVSFTSPFQSKLQHCLKIDLSQFHKILRNIING